MALVNTDWLQDKFTAKIVAEGKYTPFETTIDNQITSDCDKRGIDVIPTDGSGYIDNPAIQAIATNYANFTLIFAYSSVSDDDGQTLKERGMYYEQQYRDQLAQLNMTDVL